jgi:hypothetical protein
MVKGITHILTNDSNVQALVEQNKAGSKYKVYPNICDQPETFPYSVVRLAGKVPEQCKGIDPTTYNYRYDVLSFHKNYEDCEDLDRAVVAALTKPDGGTFNTVVFQDIRHVNTVDSYSEEYQLHVKVSSFEAMVNEDQAT